MIKKRKNRKAIVVKLILLPVFFLSASSLYAQEEPLVTDTIKQIIDEYNDEMDSAATNYFLNNAENAQSLDIHVRKLPDSAINALRNDDAFWYVNEDWNTSQQKKANTDEPSNNIFQQAWFRTLMWLIVVCSFITILIWYLSISNAGIFRKPPVKLTSGDEGVISDDIFEINYSIEINKAVSSGNYRLGVRLMFLQLLKNLSEKNIIDYTQDRTNLDYLLQLNKSSYYKDFFRLTRNYEYAWYGQFDINKEAFSSIKSDFENFNRRLD
jgi:hypothetical protein